MPLRIFNTKSRSKEEFLPLNPPHVNMYVCGITVYDYCHLGHARAAVVFDVIYRYLRHKGFDVNYVRNFTDIDDKIIRRSQETNTDWRELTQKYINAFHEDMRDLGSLPPTHEPKATDYIPEMLEMIEKLMDNGLAYLEGSNVFYSVEKFASYGKLANKKLDELEAGARVEVDSAKKFPLDFALWKGAKPGEPKWDAPWGEGRPGWHIECSSMSTKILGNTLDIHGGGRDLTFPHHENETAQSEGSTGETFVRYWIHNGFVNLNADKMSKSTGNFLTIRDVLKQFSHEAVRYFLLSSHYRSPIDFTDQNLTESSAAVERVYQTLDRVMNYTGEGGSPLEAHEVESLDQELSKFSDKFEGAMDDDFNTAQVLGHCFDLVRVINKFLDKKPDNAFVETRKISMLAPFRLTGECLGLFGQNPKEFFEGQKASALQQIKYSDQEIEQKIKERKEARKNRDFAKADQVRDELAQAGIQLKDNPDGTTTWTVK